MRTDEYNSVNPENGTVTYNGPLEQMKSNHNHMPGRTQAYLPGDERGHVNASSLSGTNDRSNIVAQNADVNHRGYRAVERGETAALKDGSTIQSEKIAVVNGQPGDRPNTFMVNDTVTYADGKTQCIHNSFTNESYADQQHWNDVSAANPDTFDAPNPGDTLRDSMSTEEYAQLMENTNAEVPGINADYAEADSSYTPDIATEAVTNDETVSSTVEGEVEAEGEPAGAEAEAEADPDTE